MKTGCRTIVYIFESGGPKRTILFNNNYLIHHTGTIIFTDCQAVTSPLVIMIISVMIMIVGSRKNTIGKTCETLILEFCAPREYMGTSHR